MQIPPESSYILYMYTSFYDVCVLLNANTLDQYWPFLSGLVESAVYQGLLFMYWSYLFIYALCCQTHHYGNIPSCVMNSLETFSDVSFVLVQLCVWYVCVVGSNTRQLVKFVMTFLDTE